MRELAYDSMVLQTQKDKDRVEQDERKKSSFKKFAKFMEEQELYFDKSLISELKLFSLGKEKELRQHKCNIKKELSIRVREWQEIKPILVLKSIKSSIFLF